MTDALIEYIQIVAVWAPVWGFALIALFMTIESSFIPFPSEVVMIPAGFMAARGELSFGAPVADAAVAILAGVVGSLLGAYINYGLSAKLGQPFLLKYGRYVLLPPAKLERAEELFRTYGAGATFVCRLLPAIRQLISIPAGLSGMPLRSFTLWTGLGAGLWVTILTAVGFFMGQHTAEMSYAELVHSGTHMVRSNWVYGAPVLAIGFFAYLRLSQRVMRSDASADGNASSDTSAA